MLDQEIKLKGDLSEISMPEVFHAISVSKATGIFQWNCDSKRKKVYIHQGKIVFATSNQKGERLGEVLLHTGMIRVKDFMEASHKLTEKKRLGQVLIEMGALTKVDIKEGVIQQVREIIYNLFNESEGNYLFEEQDKLPKEVITLNINTTEFIMRGTQRISDWNRILHTLSSIDEIFEPSAGAQKKLIEASLDGKEKKIYELVNGERTVQAVCDLISENDFQTCRTLMALLCANLIRRITDSEIDTLQEKKDTDYIEKTIQTYNRLYSYIYRYLGDKVGRMGDKNLSHYLEEIKEDYPVLLKGIFLLPDGSLAAEVIKENSEKLSPKEKKEKLLAGCKALLSAELAAVRESLGATEEAFVASRLKGIIESLNKTS